MRGDSDRIVANSQMPSLRAISGPHQRQAEAQRIYNPAHILQKSRENKRVENDLNRFSIEMRHESVRYRASSTSMYTQ